LFVRPTKTTAVKILSFVVQNFHYNTSLSTPRTRRYLYLVSLWFFELNYLVLKDTLLNYSSVHYVNPNSLPLKVLHKKHFIDSYWPRLLNNLEPDKGSYTNSLTLSTIYWNRRAWILRLAKKPILHAWTSTHLRPSTLVFTVAVSYLLFALQNKPLKTLIFYFMTWLLYDYYPYQTTFSLGYGFILWSSPLSNFVLSDKNYFRVFHI
jgi:hypothetical protein